MYQNYGNWNKKIKGKHQQNINRIVWHNVKLLEDTDEKFTVIADGIETMNPYFTCLIVYDTKGNDCFNNEHPSRENLTELFIDKMNKLKRKKSAYRSFR